MEGHWRCALSHYIFFYALGTRLSHPAGRQFLSLILKVSFEVWLWVLLMLKNDLVLLWRLLLKVRCSSMTALPSQTFGASSITLPLQLSNSWRFHAITPLSFWIFLIMKSINSKLQIAQLFFVLSSFLGIKIFLQRARQRIRTAFIILYFLRVNLQVLPL